MTPRQPSPRPSREPREPREPRRPPRDVHDPDGVRLQKVLATAGLGSRRACEQLIADGRVSVEGTVVRELGVRVDPATAHVAVDGLPLQLDTTKVYFAFNKPRGVLSTMSDPEGRLTLGEFVEGRTERVFHVGRLDAETEGLLLLTNDGDLAHHLQHPSFEVPRTYVAEVPGPVARDVGRRLRAGVDLEDGPARADSFRLVDSVPGRAVVEVVLHEGRKHVVRRMLEEVGYPVLRLARTAMGPVQLGDLKPGATRPLTREEVALLRTAGPGSDPASAERARRGAGSRPVARPPDRTGITVVAGRGRTRAARAQDADARGRRRQAGQGQQQRGQQQRGQRRGGR